MRLTITDKSASDGEFTLGLAFASQDTNVQFDSESFDSPLSVNLRQTLGNYFGRYPIHAPHNPGFESVVQKLVKLGQNYGDEWLGEDHQLVQVCETLEENGLGGLQVELVSNRVNFFNEWWESAVLPESKFVLSAACSGYTRRFSGEGFADSQDALYFSLQVDLPTNDEINQMLGGQSEQKAPEDMVKNPLKVLYVVSRSHAEQLPFAQSDALNMALQAVAEGGIVEFEVQGAMNWEQLQARLKDTDNPVHVLHYDGPVLMEEGKAALTVADSEGQAEHINVDALADVMVQSGVPALFVDPRACLDGEQKVDTQLAMAALAWSAQKAGLGNVVGLGEVTDPWSAGQCFATLYRVLPAGLSLSHAVVEARKALQGMTETLLTTVKPLAFHTSSLPVHYANQPLVFFDPAQQMSGQDQQADYKSINERLLGFRTTMLPPLLHHTGDGEALGVLEHLKTREGCRVAITGEAGSGKTQLAHLVHVYLAQKQKVDYAFAFDFAEHAYLPDDMMEMMAPVLDLTVEEKAKVVDALAEYHCSFVFDGLGSRDDIDWDALTTWVEQLTAMGHHVTVIAGSATVLHAGATYEVNLGGLPEVEHKLLAAHTLRQMGMTDVLQDKAWYALLETLQGQPWVTTKLLPQLAEHKADVLTEQVKAEVLDKPGSKVDAFHAWQWQQLPAVWQRLLALSADVRGLLLEMLMIACDQKTAFEPAKALFGLLGDDQARFSDGLKALEQSGFVQRFPHGRMVDNRALAFIQAQKAAALEGIDNEALDLAFSQVICEGVRMLSAHVLQQPNPNISNNLLLNRRHWVKHFERLWFAGLYRPFMAVRHGFDQLLQQAKLADETRLWSLDLLKRSDVPAMDSAIEAQMAWLALAGSCAGDEDLADVEAISKGAQQWQAWLDDWQASQEQGQLALFQQVVTFLEYYWQSLKKWPECIGLCEKALAIYEQHQAWQRVIGVLKSLAKYHFEVGNSDKVARMEQRIIDDIPYDNAPPGFQAQQMMDVLLARLARGEADSAQTLLDDIREREDAAPMAQMLDGLQCDIDYQQGRFDQALPHYCKMWQQVVYSGQSQQVEQLKQRMQDLQSHLGLQKFNEIYEQNVAEDTPHPLEN